MQCRGHRGNGESFTADVWFSTYKDGPKPKLAAIIADVTEETTPVGSEPPFGEHQARVDLNQREIDVLRLLVQGLANKEIAARLAISEHTVKFHVTSILGKLGVTSRTEAVSVGIRHGLVLL